MKRLIFVLALIVFISCKQKQELKNNNFDEIIHYYLEKDMDYKELEKNKDFEAFYMGRDTSKMNEIERKLTEYDYLVKNIPDENIPKINHALANDIGLIYNESACVPYFNDVLILKKKGLTKAIIKICFHCGMNSVYGKIENNFDVDRDNYEYKFSNYSNLYFALYNKKKPK